MPRVCPICTARRQNVSVLQRNAHHKRCAFHWRVQPRCRFKKVCPDCAETIKLEALVCRFCGRRFQPAEVQAAIQQAKSEFEEKKPVPAIDMSDEELMTRWKSTGFTVYADVLKARGYYME